MKPNVLAEAKAPVKSTNRLFDEAVDPEALICLAITVVILGKSPVELRDVKLEMYPAEAAK